MLFFPPYYFLTKRHDMPPFVSVFCIQFSDHSQECSDIFFHAPCTTSSIEDGARGLLYLPVFNVITYIYWGTAVAQWLRCYATNRKFAVSIPAGVSGIFIDIKSFRSHYGPGVDSAPNRNEYQKYFLGVKAASA